MHKGCLFHQISCSSRRMACTWLLVEPNCGFVSTILHPYHYSTEFAQILDSQCIVALPMVPEFWNCKLQVAISFSINYEDGFHFTHSKFHEVIPPLYIAGACCCFINLCAADHCICYAVEICSASTASCRTSHSPSSHIVQYACPLSQFMSFMHGHVTQANGCC